MILLEHISRFKIKPYSYIRYSFYYSHILVLVYENGTKDFKKIKLFKLREFERALYEYKRNKRHAIEITKK